MGCRSGLIYAYNLAISRRGVTLAYEGTERAGDPDKRWDSDGRADPSLLDPGGDVRGDPDPGLPAGPGQDPRRGAGRLPRHEWPDRPARGALPPSRNVAL